MDTKLVKLLILWIMCENIMLTTSMAVKEISHEDANTRQRRSPANNFSLFGLSLGNAVTAAKDSFSSIGSVFSGNRGDTHQNHHHESIEPSGNVRNPNTLPPTSFPRRSGIPNSTAQDDFQKLEKRPQDNLNKGFSPTVPDKKQSTNAITVPEINDDTFKNTSDSPGYGDFDKQLIDYIFQNSQFSYDNAGTTVDNNIDFVTETGEYETTTNDLGNRILPPAAVATLLG